MLYHGVQFCKADIIDDNEKNSHPSLLKELTTAVLLLY